jgi:hypothetical protein
MSLAARFTIFLLLAGNTVMAAQPSIPPLTQDQLQWLGERIFSNECNRQTACLTAWNQGEDFPSLGIGHFIWYRAGQQEIFEETFPALLEFLATQGVALPDWLAETGFEQPWPDRAAFIAAAADERQTSLRNMLNASRREQTAFIVARFARSLPGLLETLPAAEQTLLQARINAIAASNTPVGLYALIDYVHFKGTGLNARERYQGEGWGLLQVLQHMEDDTASPLTAFADSASATLQRRVANAPPERQEQRWLAGWQNRINTYRSAQP